MKKQIKYSIFAALCIAILSAVSLYTSSVSTVTLQYDTIHNNSADVDNNSINSTGITIETPFLPSVASVDSPSSFAANQSSRYHRNRINTAPFPFVAISGSFYNLSHLFFYITSFSLLLTVATANRGVDYYIFALRRIII